MDLACGFFASRKIGGEGCVCEFEQCVVQALRFETDAGEGDEPKDGWGRNAKAVGELKTDGVDVIKSGGIAQAVIDL